MRTEEDQTPVRPQGSVESEASLGWYATGFTGFTECMGWRVAEGKEQEWRFWETPRTLLLGSPSRCSRRTKLGYSGADEKERHEHSPGIKH